MDDYIRLENIESDCKRVMKKLGTPDRNIPHANKSRTYDGWRQFYDDELIDYIGNLFKEDIEHSIFNMKIKGKGIVQLGLHKQAEFVHYVAQSGNTILRMHL